MRIGAFSPKIIAQIEKYDIAVVHSRVCIKLYKKLERNCSAVYDKNYNIKWKENSGINII